MLAIGSDYQLAQSGLFTNRPKIIEFNISQFRKYIKNLPPMSYQNSSQTSLESISIKFTQSNLPSATFIKTSQEHISLNYTVSIDGISDQKIEIPQLKQNENLLISTYSKKENSENGPKYQRILPKEDDFHVIINKDVFKKKSIMKISNMDFSIIPKHDKNYEYPSMTKTKKTVIKAKNLGIFCKPKSPKNDQIIQKRINSKSKQIISRELSQNIGEYMVLWTTRFYSLKNQKRTELKNAVRVSIGKQFNRKRQNFETERKFNKLPIIRGSNFHSSAPSQMSQKRRIFSCHQNVQNTDTNGINWSEKMILGKSCKMIENDQKARKYLQKIIQNRGSVIHYSQPRANKIWKDLKQNIEELV